MTIETVTAYGWEVHFTGGTSDKYYRMIFLQTGESRWTALANYGRRGSAGQFKPYNGQSQNSGLRLAKDMTDKREDHHYSPTRELTSFEIDRDLAFSLVYGDATNRQAAEKVVREFLTACAQQGNELPNADSPRSLR